MAPGELATIAVIAAGRKEARNAFRFIHGMLHSVPMFRQEILGETQDTITLRNRVQIEIMTANFRAVRGYSLAALICDETAFWQTSETSTNPDIEVLRAGRPGLLNLGGLLIVASSPYAKAGALWEAYRRDYGKDTPHNLVWKAPTLVMNPSADRALLKREYEKDPVAAEAEFGAEFRSDLADLFTFEALEAVIISGRGDLAPVPGISYSGFLDASGGVNDSMALAIGHARSDGIGVIDCVLEVVPPFNPDEATARCAALARQYDVFSLTADKYAAEWVASRFAAYGMKAEQSARPKSDLFINFAALVNSRRIELPDSLKLQAQFMSLRRRPHSSGRDAVEKPRGGHDDLANSRTDR